MLTAFDWVVIGTVGLSALLALFRGFVREILSLAAWLIATFVTISYCQPLAEFLKPHVASSAVRMGLSTVGLFFTVLILMAIINTIFMRFLNAGSDIGILDSVLGMLFGVARGFFIIAMGYLMLSVVLEKDNLPDWLKESKTRPAVEYSANILAKLAPDKIKLLQKSAEKAAEEGEGIRKKQEQLKELEDFKRTGKLPDDMDEAKRHELQKLLEDMQKNLDKKPSAKAQEQL